MQVHSDLGSDSHSTSSFERFVAVEVAGARAARDILARVLDRRVSDRRYTPALAEKVADAILAAIPDRGTGSTTWNELEESAHGVVTPAHGKNRTVSSMAWEIWPIDICVTHLHRSLHVSIEVFEPRTLYQLHFGADYM